MQKSLGVFVSSDQHLDKIIRLCKAAKKKGVNVCIFFTHFGVLTTKNSSFSELEGIAAMSICNVSIERHELKPTIPGILEKDYATQSRHGMMIVDCDRYINF
jgi:hypothetical protein